jgi:hypothetical protein
VDQKVDMESLAVDSSDQVKQPCFDASRIETAQDMQDFHRSPLCFKTGQITVFLADPSSTDYGSNQLKRLSGRQA